MCCYLNVQFKGQRVKSESGYTAPQALFRVDAPTACSLTNTQQPSRTLLLIIYEYIVRYLKDKGNDIRNVSSFCINSCRPDDKLLIYGTVINHLLQFLRDDS